MATTQSKFSILPKKQLLFIVEKLTDEDFPVGNPYSNDFDDAYETLKSVSIYFNIHPVHEDVEFFSKFLEINDDLLAELFDNNREQIKNKELIDQLVIPVAKNYNLNYEVWGSCNYIDFKVQEFVSYDKEWVEDSALQQRNDGIWDIWDGRDRRETEYENFEESNYEFGNVYEVDEKPVRESILGKLVLENTKDVVNSLDKKTLLELKRIIDSKLMIL